MIKYVVFFKNINGGWNEIFFSPAKSINGFYGRQIDNLNRSFSKIVYVLISNGPEYYVY